MTKTIHPVDATAGAPFYSGRMLRQVGSVAFAGATAARPLGARSGVRPGTSATTVTATSTTWTVGPHAGVLDFEAASESGPTLYAIDAAVSGSMTAAHATLARVDIMWVRQDIPVEDGSAVPDVVPGYTAGTAGSGNPPAAPARCMVLAWINVPASGGGSPTVQWKAPAAVAAGAPIPVASQAERDAMTAYDGLSVYRLDLHLVEVYNGTAWTVGGPTILSQHALTGATIPTTARPIIQAFVVQDMTGASGVVTIQFPQAFTVPPIVVAMTVSGTAVPVVVNGGAITTTNVQLAWPGVNNAVVRVHVIAIGW